MPNFYLSVKSTIDRLAYNIASSLGVAQVELDDTVNVDELLGSPDNLIIYQQLGMDEDPIDPIWSLNFDIGVKTTSDAANYDMATLVGGVHNLLSKGSFFNVMDYSGQEAPTEVEGYVYVSDMTLDPQAFDGASGIRMWTIQGRAVRNL